MRNGKQAMHPPAYDFIAEFATDAAIAVIEIGSRDINGSVRPLFPRSKWTGLDLYAGPAVDVVCDASEWTPENPVELVICCEVLEHTQKWRDLIECAYRWLKPEGMFLMTCAAPGRPGHSHIDGQLLRPGEYYGNLSGRDISYQCLSVGFPIVMTRQSQYDTYASCRKANIA